MFPVSAFTPKESLPLLDVPLLTHLILEAKAAGIERLHVVTSPTKSFDALLEDRSSLHALRDHLDPALFHAANGIEVMTHLQHEPKGVGNALEAALDAISGPMLVMLGDNLLMDTHATSAGYAASQASKRLVEAFAGTGEATVGLMEVEASAVSNYGIVAMNDHRIVELVEKPAPEDAPSRLAMCGRYVFPSETQALLKTYTYEAHGDVQSIALQEHWMRAGKLHGLVLEDTQWYDSGAPLLWLQAQVDHALRREDVRQPFEQWLNRRLGR